MFDPEKGTAFYGRRWKFIVFFETPSLGGTIWISHMFEAL